MKHIPEMLKKKAKDKAKDNYKSNPAYPKRQISTGNKRSAYMMEMQDMGKE